MNIEANGILDFEVFPLDEKLVFGGSGNNAKGLFVGCAGKPTPELLELLSKMLLAAKFDMAADAYVVWLDASQPFNFSMLRNEMGFSNALFFGIRPKQAGLNVNVQPYQQVEIAGVKYLFSASLTEIQTNPTLKRPLWEGMRAMFGI